MSSARAAESALNSATNMFMKKQGDKAVVVRPYDCLVGCESCRPRCPVGAISFPSRQELKQMLRELREKYGYR
jgi:NAD-dependent dihydropyrimidine dehydrogenase PreA subunit